MLQLLNLCKSFESRTVADGISLTVADGSLTAVLGASGSGKSSLLNMIAGLLAPDGGEVWLGGVCLNALPPEQRHIAMMFQDFALLPHLNVWQNAAFGLRIRGMDKRAACAAVADLLDEAGLGGMAERRIDALSGGEKQRVALARALAGETRLLLLDEPFSGLDTALRGQLQQLAADMVRRRNIPALLVTHDPAEACMMADALALLDSGALLQYGTPQQVADAPANARAARLLGCLNVSETRYIPQRALFLDDGRGRDCAVLSCCRLPECWRIVLRDERWGDVVCLSQQRADSRCRLWVDEARIVHFQAA